MSDTGTLLTDCFEAERPRLVAIASRVLADHAGAQDVVQQAWLRLHHNETEIDNLPGWLTTVTTRLCLDRLKARTPVPTEDIQMEVAAEAADPAEQMVLADSVAGALRVVIDRLSPRERVAFVLHDSFGLDFAKIAEVLDTTPAAARKLASRARSKVSVEVPGADPARQEQTDGEVVDAFMAAAREGNLGRLIRLLAPDALVDADAAAVAAGTPPRIEGREAVAGFFNGAARAALPVFVGGRAGSAWFHQGQAKVVFDFTVVDGSVRAITFRADPEILAEVSRRHDSVQLS